MSTSTPTRPRPILKRALTPVRLTSVPLPFASCGKITSPHVHFPPTPGLTSTHAAYSPQTYDRAPIVVSRNECQMPRRNDRRLSLPSADFNNRRRGTRGNGKQEEEGAKGSYFHPRAYEACELERTVNTNTSINPPPLIPDSPSSEESDDSVETPPSPATSYTFDHPPLLTDVYTLPVPSALRSSNMRHDCPWAAARDVKTRRPQLTRSSVEKRSGRTMEFCPQLDEGCLGGF